MSKGWRTLTRSDLRTFDDNMTKAVLYAMERGGVGRLSSNGHAIIRNTTGQTMSVSRSAGGNRKANVASDLCRLFGAPDDEPAKQQAQPRPIPTATTPSAARDTEPVECPAKNCGYIGATEGAVYQHVQANHERCTETGCDYVGHNKQSVTLHHTRVHKGVNPAKGRTRRKVETTPDIATVQPTEAVREAVAIGKTVETLDAIRDLLGEDPRIAELREQLQAARDAAQRLTQERDDALTQLALVKEALHL